MVFLYEILYGEIISNIFVAVPGSSSQCKTAAPPVVVNPQQLAC